MTFYHSERLRPLEKKGPMMTTEEIEKDRKVVNHPERYGGDTVYECIKVLRSWLPPDEYRGFLRGTAIKYLCRVGKKDEAVQELEKAKWYIDRLIEDFK